MSQRDLDTHTQVVTDRNGNATTTGYVAPSSTVLTQTDALGNTITSEWNFFTMFQQHTPQNLKSTTDALGHTTSFGYTDPGMLRSISDPLGHATSFGWGGAKFDQLAQFTDPAGNVTRYVNDAQGRKTQETDPLGNVTKYTYDSAGRLLTTTKTRVALGQTQTLTTTNTVDADGNVLATTDPLGNVSKNTWTAQKQLATQTDALGRLTKYAYDPAGRQTQTTYPDGATETSAYDSKGNVTKQTDRAGRATTTAYDTSNRPTTTTNPDGTTTVTTYDAAGQVTDTADELGRLTHVDYDATGRRTATIDANGHATTYAYDSTGKLIASTDALNHTTGSEYDAANRKTKTIWTDGSTSLYDYDAAARKTKDTDPLGRATQYGYDADGRLNKVTDALSKITQYGYDELGDKTSQTDALNHVTQWAYDALGRATSHTLPDNRYETMAYDAVGRLTNRTDYAGNAGGLQYDAADRLRSQTFVDGSVLSTTYTASGQVATLTLAANGSSTLIKYSYDVRDRLTDIENADHSKLHYAYDAAGQKTRLVLTTPDGQSQTVDYTYDLAGNLKTVSTDDQTFTYQYDEANRKVERDDPNGVVTHYTYDANGRLTGFVAQKDAMILTQGTYTLNAAGQRTALAHRAPDGNARALGWSYDGAGRLTGETRSLPAHTASWTLDAVGNRTAQTLDAASSSYTYDVADRLKTVTGANAATYAWDTNGQLQSKTLGTAVTTYAFNARHLLDTVTLPDGTKISYGYAPDGNLAQRAKTLGGATQTTHYLVDPNLAFSQVVAEYDDAGHASAIYVYGDELLLRVQPSQSNRSTLYHHDGLGSVVALSDETGAAIQTYGYDAWGNRVESTGSDDNAFGFAGERFDADTVLINLRARWYDSAVGRFVSADIVDGQPKLPISHNKYLYANGDAANGIDPAGLMTLGDVGASLDIQGILGNIARDQISSYMQNKIFGCPDVDNGQPCLFDALMAQLIQAVSGSLDNGGQAAGIAAVGASILGGSRKGEKHHTVPKYMCGHESQELVYLSVPQHLKLHSELYNFKQTINIAGGIYKLVFKRKKKSVSLVADMAKRKGGRTAIAAGLGLFYYLEGYNGIEWAGLGSGVASHLPLGYVFPIEAARDEFNHYNAVKCPDDDSE